MTTWEVTQIRTFFMSVSFLFYWLYLFYPHLWILISEFLSSFLLYNLGSINFTLVLKYQFHIVVFKNKKICIT